jgi:hypothetical protein
MNRGKSNKNAHALALAKLEKELLSILKLVAQKEFAGEQ